MKYKLRMMSSKRRLQRDAIVFYALYDHRFPISYVLDMEQKRLVRTSKFDNSNKDVFLPLFISNNDGIYQIGGNSDELIGFAMADCFYFNFQTIKWERKSSIPIPRCHSCICSSENGKIFVIGGHSQMATTRMQSVDSYNPEFNVWKKLPKLIDGRFKSAVIYYDEKLYVTGGSTQERTLTECEILHSKKNHWKRFSPLNFARSAHQMVLYKNCLYVMGGKNLDGDLKSVEYYNIEASGNWIMGQNMIKTRFGFFLINFWREKLHAFFSTFQLRLRLVFI